jgi:uncharacterized membrane protein YgaE (UPF0421/DUF939 family)
MIVLINNRLFSTNSYFSIGLTLDRKSDFFRVLKTRNFAAKGRKQQTKAEKDAEIKREADQLEATRKRNKHVAFSKAVYWYVETYQKNMFEILRKNEDNLVELHKQQAKIRGVFNELEKVQEKVKEAKLKESIQLSDLKDIGQLSSTPVLSIEEENNNELWAQTQPYPGQNIAHLRDQTPPTNDENG